jgi:RNase P subunit RPR2
MPHGTCPPQPEKALIWLYDRAKDAAAARDWEAMDRYLAEAAEIVERTRLSLVE